MQYDFTTCYDRHGYDALCVETLGNGFAPDAPKDGFDPIPMWIADMNFATAPSVQRALTERIAHPIYGYFETRQEYYDAIIRWHRDSFGVEGLTADCIGYENGVLGGVASAIRALCAPGDPILIHAPTYVGFTFTLADAGYRLVHSQLVKDEQDVWRMDFGDMERKIVEHGIRAAVLCSPHNPTGRVWERWELEQAMALFEKYDIKVVCDEIWADLTMDDHRHIPVQTISEDAKHRTVATYAPSKTFNLAGLIGSYHVIYDPYLRDRVRRQSQLTHYNSMNVLSQHALLGAYCEEGRQWLNQLRQVLSNNLDYACQFIHTHFEGVKTQKPQGSYLMFADCTDWCAAHGRTIEQLLKACWDVGVACQSGKKFQAPCHLRLNLALPLHRVQEAFDRLDKYVF